MRRAAQLALLFALASAEARADRRELYTELELSPSVIIVQDSLDNLTQTAQFAFAGGLLFFYGVNDSLHIGVALRGVQASSLSYPHKTYQTQSGITPTGTFSQNLLGFGAAALLAYHVDTGEAWAPVFRLEAGATYSRYTALAFAPDNTNISYPFPDASEISLNARAVASLEYKFSDRFIASIGVSARRHFNSLQQWQFELPVTVGLIW